MQRFFSRPLYPAIAVSIIAFIVYLTTMQQSVGFIDAGELATDVTTLGIAHPTGYPLFIFLGWIFAHLPIASSIIVRLNIMAAFFTALGAGGMVFLSYELYANWIIQKRRGSARQQPSKKGSQKKEKSESQKESTIPAVAPERIGIAAFAAGLAAAFSATWWSQSNGIEVYPLHLFLVPIVLTFFIRMLRDEKPIGIFTKDAFLFSLMLGLSFTNHLTTILLAPACLYGFFARFGFKAESWRRILKLIPPFAAALLLYLYLPIRSSQEPLMNWGHPTTWHAFFKHLSGGQYSVMMFKASAAKTNFPYFWKRVLIEFAYIGLIPVIAGVIRLLKSGKRGGVQIGLFTLFLFFGCFAYSIFYEIHDIESYFLLSFLTMALWVGAGIYALQEYLERTNPQYILTGALASLFVVTVVEISLNYSQNNESGNYMVEDYTKNLLTNLPPNAIIFSGLWDWWLSGAYYYQQIEKLRPDVLVIDKAMMHDRYWYYNYLKQRAPEIMNRAQPELDNFLRNLNAFENNEPYTPEEISRTYVAFTNALIERNEGDHPIFITSELDKPDELFAPKFKQIPAGVAFRLMERDSLIAVPIPKLAWNDEHYKKRDYYTDYGRLLNALPLATYADRLLQYKDTVTAKTFFDLALKFEPVEPQDIETLDERGRQVTEAFERMREARASIK